MIIVIGGYLFGKDRSGDLRVTDSWQNIVNLFRDFWE